jgi:hypothetical protein
MGDGSQSAKTVKVCGRMQVYWEKDMLAGMH